MASIGELIKSVRDWIKPPGSIDALTADQPGWASANWSMLSGQPLYRRIAQHWTQLPTQGKFVALQFGAGSTAAGLLVASVVALPAAGGGGAGRPEARPSATATAAPSPSLDALPTPPTKPAPHRSAAKPVGQTGLGIPATVLDAYQKAAAAAARSMPGCHLDWAVLAGIGQIESRHARGGSVAVDGTAVPAIYGPRLDGSTPGTNVIRDTDDGRYDNDTEYDRAVGPMQILPGTFERYGADGNGDGRRDPQNVYDAALTAANYLCAGGRDLARPKDLRRALFAYNNVEEYVRTVLRWIEAYRTHGPIATNPGTPPSSSPRSSPPRPRPSSSGTRTPSPDPTCPPVPSGSGSGPADGTGGVDAGVDARVGPGRASVGVGARAGDDPSLGICVDLEIVVRPLLLGLPKLPVGP